MNNISRAVSGCMIVFATGCASTLTKPLSGPTADLSVTVTNFAAKRSMTHPEKVYLSLNNEDNSWGGEQLINRKHPEYTLRMPAGKEISFTLKLVQSNGRFSSGCGVSFEMTPTANSELHADFEFIRATQNQDIISCTAHLFSGSRKIGSYTGSSNTTVYKLAMMQ